MNILHIGHSPGWRGGENQARLLIQYAAEIRSEYKHFLAYPSGAIIFDRLNSFATGQLELYSKKPFDLRSIFVLLRFCKFNDIDILHAHSASAHTLGIIVKRFLPHLKLVIHRRVDNPIKTNKLTRSKYLSSKVDKFISVSQATNDILLSNGVATAKIELIYDSIDVSVYSGRSKAKAKADLVAGFGWPEKTPLIGFISAVDSQKNPKLFVEIIKGLIESGVDVNAVIAGQGKLVDDVSSLIDLYGLSSKIKMMGFVKEVDEIFLALDVFILPSRNEGLGTVMLEAIAASTVVVASNVGGIGEVIIDRQTGRLIAAGEVDVYVSAVSELVHDKELRKSLVKGAAEHIRGRFDLTNMVTKTLDIYAGMSSSK